jgi:hypothetical protein
MKNFKRIFRLLTLVFFMVLAMVGVGLGGGIPIPSSNRREDTIVIKVELVESEEDQKELSE